ncbi:hypothetical protein KC19_12G143500 [Ceratodon purpureus]|uniref:Uncharacterized protein n=1 Tax=Ceratodon purpureus TaxID=3225 RepID=A0A8T0G9Q5_CERPU|nr:hypothetical protein KC19_12G143500 [Ceratodon purpureus]
MATQCHRLAVHSLTGRLSTPPACSSTSRGDSRVNQSSVFLRGQRLQLQRMSQHSVSSRSRSPVQCVSSTFGSSSSEELDKSGEGRVQNNVIANMMAKAPEPIRIFPWGKAWSLFVQRVVFNFWTVGKWLAIPVLAVSMLSELSYTLLQQKVLIIPAGMIGGIAFAGMMRETALELFSEFETGEVAWHLVALGLFFAALKFISPYLPVWGRVSVPHFANGGLWQVIKLANDWRKQHAEKPVKRS